MREFQTRQHACRNKPEKDCHNKGKSWDDIVGGRCKCCRGELHPHIVQILVYYWPEIKNYNLWHEFRIRRCKSFKHVMLMHAVLRDSLEHYSSNPRSITLRNTETVNFGRIFLQIMETRVLKACNTNT